MADGIELLSPAGNFRALTAAVQSGADAVYIGGKRFSARGSAENFTVDEIKRCADYCHLYGVKLHAAVNTLVKERELDALAEYARDLNRTGVDALIVQDLGAARIIRKICPDMPLHASTQMTVTSAEGVKYLENMGFSRVVLARELTKREIEHIINNTGAEIEVFVHGALCMCYSGQCLMSSILGGRSANRGRCAQPCRLPYDVGTGDTKVGDTKSIYALSPKDLSLVNELDELKRMGVKSLKIEGRLKRAEYVSAVTGIYRKYLDGGGKITDADTAELKNAFSRSGFTDGYFKGKTGAAMMSHRTPGNVSDNVFADAVKRRAEENANVRKIPVTIYTSLKKNDVLNITITDDDYNTVTVSGTLKSERAQNAPITSDRLKQQLNKLGSTPFETEGIYAETDDGITIPVREINAVRRKACEMLADERTKGDTKREDVFKWGHINKKSPERVLITAECETAEQAEKCMEAGIDVLYVPAAVYDKIAGKTGDTKTVVREADIFDGADISADKIMVHSFAAVRYYEKKTLYGGARLNVFNSVTADVFRDMELVALSPELNIGEVKAVVRNTAARCEIIAYGRLTLMLMKNCPVKAAGKCRGHKNEGFLRDRKNEIFPVLCGEGCMARLINSKPVFTADKLSDIMSIGADALKLIFTIETPEETAGILKLYKDAMKGRAVKNPFGENAFTRGHYYRGVE